ncbi:MAG: TetR/AcrR family transcriptional regulator [Desulfovibrio sp.]|nr:TetR/AcrR family transcriptional regulator [Desulfovibrio sp.]
MSAERILTCALNRFVRQGYDSTSLSEIAADAGIRKPSIYAHFASKKQIFMKLLELAWEKERERVEQLATCGDPDALRNYIRAIRERCSEDNFLLFWLMAIYMPPAGLDAEIYKYDALYAERMDAAIKAALKIKFHKEALTPGDEIFIDAYAGIIRCIHAELLYHGPDHSESKAKALWKIFELASPSADRLRD